LWGSEQVWKHMSWKAFLVLAVLNLWVILQFKLYCTRS
jgi:hypothetical protein